jgi:excisionase family DNA binding protein
MNHSKRDQALLDEKASDELLMPKQVAALFGINRHTLREWATTGRLRAVEITSGHRRYWRSDVERLLAERDGRRGACEGDLGKGSPVSVE